MSLVSIVIPVYYNEGSLPILFTRLETLRRENPKDQFEFIFVDDGSGDHSFDIISRFAQNDSGVRIVKMTRNFGTYLAITAGMQYSKGDCVACLAADLQDPPETITKMIVKWRNGNKAVLAVRNDRHGDPPLTRLFANTFNRLYNRFVFNGFSPQGVGFFLIDRQLVNLILQSEEKNANLVGLILWSGFGYSIIPYDRPERKHGKSKWNFQKKFKYFIDSFVAFSYLPVRLATILGLSFATIGVIYAILIVIIRLIKPVEVQGWSAIMVALLILSGVQLTILGIIGEYLWRNFDATRRRPLYVVERFIANTVAENHLTETPINHNLFEENDDEANDPTIRHEIPLS